MFLVFCYGLVTLTGVLMSHNEAFCSGKTIMKQILWASVSIFLKNSSQSLLVCVGTHLCCSMCCCIFIGIVCHSAYICTNWIELLSPVSNFWSLVYFVVYVIFCHHFYVLYTETDVWQCSEHHPDTSSFPHFSFQHWLFEGIYHANVWNWQWDECIMLVILKSLCNKFPSVSIFAQERWDASPTKSPNFCTWHLLSWSSFCSVMLWSRW
jgi:hypothetical protein